VFAVPSLSVTPIGEIVPVTWPPPVASPLWWKIERTVPPVTVYVVPFVHGKVAPVGSNVVTCALPALPAAPAGKATTNATAIAATASRTAVKLFFMGLFVRSALVVPAPNATWRHGNASVARALQPQLHRTPTDERRRLWLRGLLGASENRQG
jgi:hypothetical protein